MEWHKCETCGVEWEPENMVAIEQSTEEEWFGLDVKFVCMECVDNNMNNSLSKRVEKMFDRFLDDGFREVK